MLSYEPHFKLSYLLAIPGSSKCLGGYVDLEIAHVRLSETEAVQQEIHRRVVTLSMNAVLRARAVAETCGFMKALLDTQSEHILGFSMLGAEAGEVVAVVQTAMSAGFPYRLFETLSSPSQR